jgi:hypothetical protein
MRGLAAQSLLGSSGGPIVRDTFTTPTGTLAGRAADTGQTWSITAGTWTVGSGQLQLPTTDDTYATLATGVTSGNYDVSVTLRSADANANGVVGRYVDANNWYLADENGSTGLCRLFKRVAGSFQIGSTASGGSGNGDKVTLSMVGTAIKVKRNGTTVISTTDSSFTSGGTAGIRRGYGGSGTGLVDDFEVV